MKIEFFGTAGYHPNAERHTSSSYIEDASPEAGFVLDAGTGLFRLINRPLPPELYIFLSHAHLDHVAGLTYLYNVLNGKKSKLTVIGSDKTLRVVRESLFDSPLFPLKWTYDTRTIVSGEKFEVAGVKVSCFDLTHPGGCLAFRFDWPDRSLAYVTDTLGDGRYIDFIRDVDLLVHERNFSDDLQAIAAISGHCTSTEIVNVARASGAKRLALTHFNPLTNTDPLEEDALRDQLPGVISARDGLVVEF